MSRVLPTSASPRPSSAFVRSRLAAPIAAAIVGGVALGGMLVPMAAAAAADTPIDGSSAHPQFGGLTHFTGEFHSHTGISDGVDTPADAFAHVASKSELDFFSTTEHDVTMDVRAADDFTEHAEDAHSGEWAHLHEAADEFNAQNDDLVALPGEEITWYNGTGHINLFNTDWFITATSRQEGSADGLAGAFPKGDYKYDLATFYARVVQDDGAVAQFNHPSPTGKGNFDQFKHITPEIDDKMQLFEYKAANYATQWQLALDRGWHLAPVFNGDEHSANWVTGNPSLTGIWAADHTLDGLYSAMNARSMYSSFDVNAIMAFSANDAMMGSILDARTDTLDLRVQLTDPDGEAFSSVELIGNGGRVLRTFSGLTGSTHDLSASLPAADGDYVYARATQADGNLLVSAPIWVGEVTRGTDFAPEIDLLDSVPSVVSESQRIDLPRVSTSDDSGVAPTVSYEVFNGQRMLPITGDAFTVEGYDDHFIVVKSTDNKGNTSAELIRLEVSKSALDADAVFRLLGSVATVGAVAGEAGLAVVTDLAIEKTWAQVLPADENDWSKAVTIESSNQQVFELDSTAAAAATWIDSAGSHPMRSHEFDLVKLKPGESYQYRFGTSAGGDWTPVKGTFLAGGAGNAPVYVLGDLQSKGEDMADYALFNDMVDTLRDKQPGGETLVQVGDLVDNGGREDYWSQVFEYVLDDLDLQFATMVGNHETYGDAEFNDVLSTERNDNFTSVLNMPKNGSTVGESNYSFDRGDIHFSVLNSNYDLDVQLQWLIDDVQASDKSWQVVMGHFPYYGASHSDDAGMETGRARISAVVEELGIDLYVGGHDHVYKRHTIRDGALVTDDALKPRGTTFVTMGSSGPKFYDNESYWWDDVVYDIDTQTGLVLDVGAGGLTATAYTVAGDVIDSFTLTQPEGEWGISRAAIENRELAGVSVYSEAGVAEEVTVIAAAYDLAQEEMVEVRTATVQLDRRGSAQRVVFDSPLPVAGSNTVKLFGWDSLGNSIPVTAEWLLREGMTGEGTAEDPYQLSSWDDVAKIVNDPAAHYELTSDLVLDGTPRGQIGFGAAPFTGTFDGAGHSITGFVPAEGGAGVFAVNYGTIRNLAVQGVVATASKSVGLLADHNYGTIETSWSSGAIDGASRVGGLVGDNYGTVRDSYSTANVHSAGTEVGGLVAVSLAGSVVERGYSSGAVASDIRNVGGVVGYAYESTVVENVISLNSAVTATSFAHAVVGRVLAGQEAELSGNLAWDAGFVSVQTLADAPAADNWKGEIVAAADARSEALYTSRLGWDLDAVWVWNAGAQRPTLRAATETYVELLPELAVDDRGYYQIASAEQLRQLDLFRAERFVLTADIDLSAVADFAPLAARVPFAGELDGAGHSIVGLSSSRGGLFELNGGYVHDLGIEAAAVTKATARAGIVANTNSGTLERVYSTGSIATTGSIAGTGRVGGLAGDNAGVIRDSYSTATVHTGTTEAGGLVGVALAGSITERVYASGAVSATTRNIGGVVGYGYTGTQIRNSIALNATITAPSFAQRVLGRVLAGNTATLENNWAADFTVAGVSSDAAAPAATNLHGATATGRQTRSLDFFGSTLGWDSTVWMWSVDAQRPMLRAAVENYTGPIVPGIPAPTLDVAADGAYIVAEPADLAQVEAFPTEHFRLGADLDLMGVDARIDGTFSGVFDGDGYSITGFASTTGGLFSTVSGTVQKLSIDGTVSRAVTALTVGAGILADRVEASGVISQVSTAGTVSGQQSVGGVVGYLLGALRDSYSTAAVTASGVSQAGGIAGITGAGSLTERVYSTGVVTAQAKPNAGGLSGYGYPTTTIRNSFALNPSVTASLYAARIVARSTGTTVPLLTNNFAVDTLVPTVQSSALLGGATFNGESKTTADAQQQATFEAGLGWDFASVWVWDADTQRPVLQAAR